MRTDLAFMRVHIYTILAALIALALIPSTALAAPKKVSLRFSATSYSVTESNTTFNVTVQRSGPTAGTTSVNYAVDPSSTAVGGGVNYSFTPGTLTFTPGQTQKTFPVTIVDNSTFNPPNKTIVFKLSGAPAGVQLKNNPATLTIIDNDGPGTIDLSSSTYSVVESAGVATVTVTRASATNISESVQYTTTALAPGAGNATAGVDYLTSSGTLTFAVGEMSKTFAVPILDDPLYEGNEVLNLTLSNPQNVTNPLSPPTLGPNNGTPATLTIVDDDVPTFSFSSPTYSIMENAGTKTITVVRGGATNIAASVDYSDAGTGSAATPGDYSLTAGTLNFAAGETTKNFSVSVVNNAIGPQPNKTVGLQLTTSGTQVATSTLSIVDDDDPVPSVQFSDVGYSVNESATTATVTVTLSKTYDGDVAVHYATSDGTGTAGSPSTTDGTADYSSTSGTLTFKGNLTNPGGIGETSKTIDIPLNPDAVVEGDETFDVALSANTNSTAGSPASTVVTIVDDDDFGDLEFNSLRYDVAETDGQATITVRRVGGVGGAVAVDYFTSDGSAHAPGDYTTSTGTLDFAAGVTEQTFQVPISWDGQAEGDETVTVGLQNAANGANLGANDAAVLHIADDGASGPVQFSTAGYTIGESAGMATITVNRSGNLGGPVTVDYATSDGSASAGSDYTETHGTLTFGPGETTKTFDVPVTSDSTHESDETVTLTLSNPGGGTTLGSPATAALTITDDDAAPAGTPDPEPPAAETPTPQTPATPPAEPNLQSSPANPNPAGSQTAAVDKVAPKLTLSAKKLQRALKAKVLVIKVRSNEAARLTLTGKVFTGKKGTALGKKSTTVGTGKTVTIKLKLNKKSLAAIRKALLKGKAKVTFTVAAVDGAGNKASAARKITVS